MLELRGVTKVYETGGLVKRALDDVTINFRASEFVAVLGPSGSGKTTLLNIIGGLDHYTSGDLEINEVSTKDFRDKDWDAYRNHRIGFVFQAYNLIPHQTVLSNVKLALTLSGISRHEATRRARKALEKVGLGDQINKRPNQLSGGQMQRVAIARALVNNPDILLADEPTGALDSETSLQVMDILKKISRNRLVIMVTHNPELADKYATRVVKLKDGKVVSDSRKYSGRRNTKLDDEGVKRRRRKTRMSFFTAFGLSLKNLLTKKTRTLLVSFAGSIGIIGIALILAVSTGFQAYIDSIEQNTLTSYPLMLLRESADISGMLLGVMGGGESSPNEEEVVEVPMLSSMLGGRKINDLKNFRKYLDNHNVEIEDDIRLIEYEYNVDPPIYTIDVTGAVVKVNPSSILSDLMGNSILMSSSYSSMASAFEQYELENMKNDLTVVAGRLPENYNEMILYLSDTGQISEYLVYSLGFHDTEKLTDAITKTVTGEEVDFGSEALTLSYEDLMSADLRLVNPVDLYKYNTTYNIYEDMSGDEKYMREIYARAEPLKIVGIATIKDGMLSAGSGVLYLPSLPVHIIEQSAETEIVKKQLAEPSINIFTGKKFGEKSKTDLEFSDLVSVDTSKIRRAFSFDLNEEKLKSKAGGYIESAIQDLLKQIVDELKVLEPDINEKAEEVRDILTKKLTERLEKEAPEFVGKSEEEIAELMEKIVMEVAGETIKEIDFSELEQKIKDFNIEKRINKKVDGLIDYLSSTVEGAFSVDESMLMSAFSLNFSEEELARLITTMYTQKEATLSSNLSALGYQALDDPSRMSFYFNSFDGKTNFVNFIDEYNEMMESYQQDDKIIEYTDVTGVLMSSVKAIVDAVSYILIAFVSISLIVSSIMIGVITYISVYERTKEIGILRAIGASKRNISSIFNAETFIVGLLAGLLGIGISYILIPIINAIMHHYIGSTPFWAQLDPRSALVLIGLSVILTLIGGLIPARAAAKKDPVEALRSE